jgi:hypothetical protein
VTRLRRFTRESSPPLSGLKLGDAITYPLRSHEPGDEQQLERSVGRIVRPCCRTVHTFSWSPYRATRSQALWLHEQAYLRPEEADSLILMATRILNIGFATPCAGRCGGASWTLRFVHSTDERLVTQGEWVCGFISPEPVDHTGPYRPWTYVDDLHRVWEPLPLAGSVPLQAAAPSRLRSHLRSV